MIGPQRLLGDRYVIGSTLGIGGMAEVFSGTDLRLGREVAVKVLRADLARDPSFQQRFRREAQSAALLNAPEIVSVYDSGEDTVDGALVPWIVMEHVHGRTLREVLHEEGPLPPVLALQIVADVCAALQVAHDAGIVHRDIKPGNVMLTPAGDVKVMDFGIARAVSSVTQTMTQTASVIGTAAYLSPEQARGDHVDARSDLYSTGCLLYELLVGRAPFTGDSVVAVAYQHVREEAARPSALDPALAPAVDAVVMTALAKDPAARYQTAAAMREDLLRAAAGQPVAAPPPPAPSVAVAGPGAPRSRRVAYALFALLLLAVVGGVGYGVRSLLSRPSTQVPAPSVLGLSQQQAQSRLSQSDLVVGQVQRVFQAAPLGQVVGQSPSSGTAVRRGGQVDLVVSEGPQMTLVPPVVGTSQEEAQATLTQAQLGVAQIVPRVANAPSGQVLEVVPSAGSTVPLGQKVTLVVASGQVEVPVVTKEPLAQAAAALQAAGFNVGVRLRDDAGPPGVVLSQDPASGPAPRGSTVTVVVSRAAVPAPRPTPTPSPSPSGGTTSPPPSSVPPTSRAPSGSPPPSA